MFFSYTSEIVVYMILICSQVSTVGEEIQYNPRLTKDEVSQWLNSVLFIYKAQFTVHVFIINWL